MLRDPTARRTVHDGCASAFSYRHLGTPGKAHDARLGLLSRVLVAVAFLEARAAACGRFSFFFVRLPSSSTPHPPRARGAVARFERGPATAPSRLSAHARRPADKIDRRAVSSSIGQPQHTSR